MKLTPEQMKELAKDFCRCHQIDCVEVVSGKGFKGFEYTFFNERLVDFTEAANAEAIKLHMESLSKDAVAWCVIEDGAIYSSWNDGQPTTAQRKIVEGRGQTIKLRYEYPPEVEALQADNDRLASLLTLAETKEFSKSAKLAVAIQDNDRLRTALNEVRLVVENRQGDYERVVIKTWEMSVAALADKGEQ